MTDLAGPHEVEEFRRGYAAVREELGRVIVGHETLLELVVTALMADGHVLLEGVPGSARRSSCARSRRRSTCASRGFSSPQI